MTGTTLTEGADGAGRAGVLIVARSPVTRAGLRRLIEADDRFRITGSVNTAAEAAALLADSADAGEAQPGVVLLDDAAPEELRALLAAARDEDAEPFDTRPDDLESEHGGADADGSYDAGYAAPAVVAFIAEPDEDRARAALRAGARGILSAQSTEAEILLSIEAAAAGLVCLPPELLTSLLNDAAPARENHQPAAHEHLTPRETEVLRMLAEGLANKTIAWRLGISEHTVKFHVASVFAKLGASSRTEAVTLGLRRGLIML